ncbi:MAG TPA: roadblock/LC7 domain-containing protein [Planctomycetota bacterium]|jgi:predicted regulator of Ras-like GTPase activity (Roadblock/LC7/MglB family)
MAMGKADESLRSTRLVFYKEDIERIAKTLNTFLKNANARCVLLVDKDGHLVTKEGESSTYDMDTISALVAGSFAATKQMAKLLGEEEFSIMFHQGKKDNIQLSLVGERTILAVIFDDKTTLGMVRLYASQVSSKLAELFSEIAERKSEGEKISQEFGQAAKGKLDDIFGA